MTKDEVTQFIEAKLAQVNAEEAEAWRIVNDNKQVQANQIRAQLVIQFCIKERDNLLTLANSFGQFEQQYEASLRANSARIQR